MDCLWSTHVRTLYYKEWCVSRAKGSLNMFGPTILLLLFNLQKKKRLNNLSVSWKSCWKDKNCLRKNVLHATLTSCFKLHSCRKVVHYHDRSTHFSLERVKRSISSFSVLFSDSLYFINIGLKFKQMCSPSLLSVSLLLLSFNNNVFSMSMAKTLSLTWSFISIYCTHNDLL